MGWSIRVGRIAGIPVQMHLTFLLLLVWVGLSHWLRSGTPLAVIIGIVFMLALFGCVLLHELGHALMARRYGIQTKDITLLPIGGLARLEKMPDDPKQELWVALAGPAVNVVIAACLFLWLQLAGGWEALSSPSVSEGSLVERLLMVNIFLVGFNLLPAFPMDGGRILRAALAMKMDYAQATRIAASIGQMMAFGFGSVGLFGNPFLLFIAFFVWIGAAQEANQAQVKSALSEMRVERAMQTRFVSLTASSTLAHAVEQILAGAQQDFPVLWDGEVIGMLTRDDLVVALASHDSQTRVADVMRREFRSIEADAPLEPLIATMGMDGTRTLPVMRNGQLVGLLTLENIGELMMIESALRSHKATTDTQGGEV